MLRGDNLYSDDNLHLIDTFNVYQENNNTDYINIETDNYIHRPILRHRQKYIDHYDEYSDEYKKMIENKVLNLPKINTFIPQRELTKLNIDNTRLIDINNETTNLSKLNNRSNINITNELNLDQSNQKLYGLSKKSPASKLELLNNDNYKLKYPNTDSVYRPHIARNIDLNFNKNNQEIIVQSQDQQLKNIDLKPLDLHVNSNEQISCLINSNLKKVEIFYPKFIEAKRSKEMGFDITKLRKQYFNENKQFTYTIADKQFDIPTSMLRKKFFKTIYFDKVYPNITPTLLKNQLLKKKCQETIVFKENEAPISISLLNKVYKVLFRNNYFKDEFTAASVLNTLYPNIVKLKIGVQQIKFIQEIINNNFESSSFNKYILRNKYFSPKEYEYDNHSIHSGLFTNILLNNIVDVDQMKYVNYNKLEDVSLNNVNTLINKKYNSNQMKYVNYNNLEDVSLNNVNTLINKKYDTNQIKYVNYNNLEKVSLDNLNTLINKKHNINQMKYINYNIPDTISLAEDRLYKNNIYNQFRKPFNHLTLYKTQLLNSHMLRNPINFSPLNISLNKYFDRITDIRSKLKSVLINKIKFEKILPNINFHISNNKLKNPLPNFNLLIKNNKNLKMSNIYSLNKIIPAKIDKFRNENTENIGITNDVNYKLKMNILPTNNQIDSTIIPYEDKSLYNADLHFKYDKVMDPIQREDLFNS